MALDPGTEHELRSYWAAELGVTADAFADEGVTVGASAGADIELLAGDGSLVVGAPESLVPELRNRREELGALDLSDPDAIREVVASLASISEVHGPAFLGYTDESSFDPVESGARLLTRVDRPAFDRFREAVPDSDWDAGGPEFVPDRTVGLFHEDRLVAAAGCEVWDDRIAHIGVVTHPAHRGEGNGRAVVSRATEQALAADLLAQYRTLDAWPWSVALAEGLGFERFATSVLAETG
ncbi:GNAT family N-acetyltransferase [Haloarchaeobius amylolyticus]|uniref:GNAT family N-acetyltransferase n=1 Tax=Haloarchaeobius amylolyticus TaxID=1198296 RepID=UPI0022712885|nr:GNAT family N-acetyltransferase [Haloarchaeobius amylolyticus]